MKTAILKINNISRRNIFWVLMSFSILFLGSYIYFITQTIVNTASYRVIEKELAVLNSNISELESDYFSLKKSVNLNLAKELGYVEVSNIKFIDKDAISQTLSLVKTIE